MIKCQIHDTVEKINSGNYCSIVFGEYARENKILKCTVLRTPIYFLQVASDKIDIYCLGIFCDLWVVLDCHTMSVITAGAIIFFYNFYYNTHTL